MNDPTTLTISEAQHLLQRRELSAADLLEAHLEKIAHVDPRVKAFLRTTPGLGAEQAAAADRAGGRGDEPSAR